MDWLQVLTIAGSTIGACFFMHRESLGWHQEHQKEMASFKAEIQNEIRDFHGRLCALEEKYIQMMERFMESRK